MCRDICANNSMAYNPLTPTAIQKLLEIIDSVRLYPSCSFADRSRLRHKPDYRLGWSSEDVRKSTYACRSVSVACRPAEKRRRRGKIGSIHRSILVGHRRPNRRLRVKDVPNTSIESIQGAEHQYQIGIWFSQRSIRCLAII